MPTLNSEHIFKGKVFSVDRDRVQLASGREVTLDVIRHPKSVVLIPIPEPGHLVLVRQYRHAVHASLWELPAGSVDPGETPEDAARRECHEEVGLVPTTVVRLAALYPTPGYCDEEMVFFRLSGLEEPTEPAALDEDEEIEVKIVELREAREMVRRGEIVDMKTVVGLTLI
ncbi:MAG TPA: NUDIX hydrolase [Vicinamibacterales bacterium]|jgi:ADP-ribose pyrophosphatase